MKQQVVCPNCHQKFFSDIIKVYVFKRHFCPDDKEETLRFDGKNVFSCEKCKRVFHKDNLVEYGSMGTGIMGTTRTRAEVDKRMTDGKTDYEVVNVPTEQYCRKCSNWARHRMQLEANEQRKSTTKKTQVRAFPKEITNADVYKYEIHQKVQQDFQIEQRRLQQEQQAKAQDEARKKQEAAAKAAIVGKMAEELIKKDEKKEKAS
jgi:ribosomal protein L37AE/L43A